MVLAKICREKEIGLDNAAIESFFARLKMECFHGKSFESIDLLVQAALLQRRADSAQIKRADPESISETALEIAV